MKNALLLLVGILLAGCHPPKPAAVLVAPAVPAPPIPSTQAQAVSPIVTGPSALQVVLTLSRYHWQLVSAVDGGGQRIAALFVQPDKPLQLDFNASLVSVGNACNVMSARHKQTGDSLTIEPFASTMHACSEPGMTGLDQVLRQHLQGKLGMRLTDAVPPQLVLVTAAGDTLTWAGRQDAPAHAADVK